jgi:hypothetical protein
VVLYHPNIHNLFGDDAKNHFISFQFIKNTCKVLLTKLGLNFLATIG